MKKILSLLFGLCLMAGCSSSKLESISLSCDDTQIKKGETITIEVTTDPEDFTLSEESFHVTNKGKVKVDGDEVTFTAKKRGEYQITASQDGVSSNTLIITVEKSDEKEEDPTVEEEEKDEPVVDAKDHEDLEDDTSSLQPDADEPKKEDSSQDGTVISWSQSDPLTVEETIEHGDLLEKSGQSIWLSGDLPQTIKEDQGEMILYDDTHSLYISIYDPNHLIDFGGGKAMIVGPLTKTESGYQIEVEKAYML